MDHVQRIQQEFTRQAVHFAASAKISDSELTQRFVDAVAPDTSAVIMDVACGPGLVTAALAPRAREVVALDVTPEMLRQASQRCAAAGVGNVTFREGSATALPFADASFDAVVTRLSLHHFPDPAPALSEMARVLRPGGRFVVADVTSSEDPGESALHNAIEILRDPSHVRMLPESELLTLIRGAGFAVETHSTWDMPREFEEWVRIVDDPHRVAPVRTVVRTLARLGQHAGFGLSLQGDSVAFFHRWHLIAARKPAA